MTKVKICGITNLEDALISVKFGADALGFNFYQKSPRYITAEKTLEIVEKLPKKVLKVGVFVNETLENIISIAEIAKLDAIQLHGEESPAFAQQLKEKTDLEIIKAFRVSSVFKPEEVLEYQTDAILLDAYNPKEHGGTGETFDWSIAFKVKQLVAKLYLAGGLSSSNVDTAILKVQPFAVDACSGVEKTKGKKDKHKIYRFISIANSKRTVAIRNPFKINNIYDLLLMIEIYPSNFLGKLELNRLLMFLYGIKFGLNIENASKYVFDWKQFEPNIETSYAHGFQGWIAKKILNQETSAYDWAYIIVEYCNGDEEKAFDLFFELLEEFKFEKELDLYS